MLCPLTAQKSHVISSLVASIFCQAESAYCYAILQSLLQHLNCQIRYPVPFLDLHGGDAYSLVYDVMLAGKSRKTHMIVGRFLGFFQNLICFILLLVHRARETWLSIWETVRSVVSRLHAREVTLHARWSFSVTEQIPCFVAHSSFSWLLAGDEAFLFLLPADRSKQLYPRGIMTEHFRTGTLDQPRKHCCHWPPSQTVCVSSDQRSCKAVQVFIWERGMGRSTPPLIHN